MPSHRYQPEKHLSRLPGGGGNVSVPQPRKVNHSGELRGAALVIVLSFLIILTGLIVAFLSSVTDEATSTAASASAITTRSLADAAIQLTIAQIRDATAGFARDTNTGTLDTTKPTGWASQPGGIRVFTTSFNGNMGAGSGGALAGNDNLLLYKLYSAQALVDASGGAPSNDLPPSGWWNKKALYVDLNAPVSNSVLQTNIYPIMDPSLAMTNPLTGQTNPTNVDGFSIDTTVPCYYSSNPAAMPVAWIYMLKDGTLTVPSSDSSNAATFTSNAPTSNNPIVGRIAFWTDDETCKLNINTASEGVPWNPPTFTSPEDTGFNNYAPGANEFNRFLGHPFSVSLSPVLWSFFGLQHPAQLLWSTPPYWSNSVFLQGGTTLAVWTDLPPVPSLLHTNVGNSTNYLAALLGMSNVVNGIHPRTAFATNGSFLGSFRTVDTNNRALFTNVPARADRLYASVDEMNFLATNGLLSTRTNNSEVFSPQMIAKLRFFLTTHSRAPEVNILNLPRICLWPLNDTNTANINTVNSYMSPTNRWSFLDKMIAQCATLGTNPYYFTRYDPLDPNNDANIPRNKVLYGYLAKLLQSPLPGFASTNGIPSSFATRWGAAACYETATLCFDYIRSCINLIDSYGSGIGPNGTDATNPAVRYAYSYTAPPTNFSTSGRDNADASGSIGKVLPPGCGQVVPITITTNSVTTRGMGRFPVIKSVNLVFCAVAADQPPLMVSNTGVTPRVPIVPWQVNPLHPYPSNTALSSFNSNSGWDYPSSFTLNYNDTNEETGIVTAKTRAHINVVTVANQYPSLYPATNTANYSGAPISLANFTRGTNAYGSIPQGIGWSNNWATNIPIVYYTTASAAQITNGTNSYQFLTTNGIPGFTNAHALTITHPGLVYGGDLDSNNPVGTNYGFDAYNLYFSNIATILGITATASSVNYINQIFVSNKTVPPLATNYVTNLATIPSLTIPNTNPPNKLFPNLYETVMQPVLLLDQALTTPGFPPYTPNFKIRIRGLGSLTADGSNCFASGDYGQLFTNTARGGRNSGQASGDAGPDLFGMSTHGNGSNNWTNGNPANSWPFVGNFVKATNSASPNFGRTFQFGGGTITIDYLKPSASYTTASPSDIIQSVTIVFPSSKFPTPKLPPFNGTKSTSYNTPPWHIGFGTNLVSVAEGTPNAAINFIDPRYLLPSNSLPPWTNMSYGAVFGSYFPGGWFFMNEQWGAGVANANGYSTATTIRAMEAGYGDWRLPAMMRTIGASGGGVTAPSSGNYGYTLTTMTNLYIPHLLYFASNAETSSGLASGTYTNNTNYFWRSAHSVRSLSGFLADAHSGHIFSQTPGEFLQSFVNASTNGNDPGLWCGNTISTPTPPNTAGKLLSHIGPFVPTYTIPTGPRLTFPDAMSTVDFVGYVGNNISSANLFSNVWTNGGDFDNPTGGAIMDGPYINKADEGTVGYELNLFGGSGGGYNGPYPTWSSLGRARFSPNRQVPSAGILGSLPAGFDPSNPSLTNAWKSLVFCPNPNASNRVTSMPNPPDYMIMDLFDMPVVQPYPISDPFSTAGRVNLNYQIAPFSHIKRDSALRGVLKSVDMAAVPERSAGNYKYGYRQYTPQGTNGVTNYYSYYYPVHLNETLKKFDAKFATNGFFRVGAEICSMWLYPALAPNNGTISNNVISTYLTNPARPVVSDASNSIVNIYNWWYANPGTTRKGLTGANVRARPYAGIYANITTKSNTYQIHYRVQTLKQTPSAHPSDWKTWKDPSAGGITDKVVGELRGSAVIERYIDPSDSNIPDFTTNVKSGGGIEISAPTMDAYYRFRVFSAKQFTP